MTEYEKSEFNNEHTITSSQTLDCADTGRVIAVFYNDYDLDELLKKVNEPDAKSMRLAGFMHSGEDICLACGLAAMKLEEFEICDNCCQCPECGCTCTWSDEDGGNSP